MLEKNDFIELEFTGIVKDGEIFDTNVKANAEKIGLKIEEKPFIICIGKGMVVDGLDKSLEGKEIGKKYTIELAPNKAFLERKKDLIKLIPLKLFTDKNVIPKPGMTLALDNTLVRIVSVSGGRVLADFNNPLSGKIVVYEFKIKRKVEDVTEKINSLLDYFLGKRIDFKIEEKKAIFETNNSFELIIKMINDKFKDVLGIELIIKEFSPQ